MDLDFLSRGDSIAEIGLDAPSVKTGPSSLSSLASLEAGTETATAAGSAVFDGLAMRVEKSSPLGGSHSDSPVPALK